MALYTTLSSLSQTASANAADGSVDAPSTIDQQTNALASFIAQLRDGLGFTGQLGYKNRIRNGNFPINQRAVSGTVTVASGVYGHDGWKGGASGCTYTFTTSGLDTTINISAGSLQQVVEGAYIEGGNYAMSWSGTAQGKIGAGSYGATGTTGTGTAGSNLTIEFNTGTMTKVQLEAGTNVSAFERRPITLEQAICQRYYQQVYAGLLFLASTGGAQQSVNWSFPVLMRTTPTVAVFAAGSALNATLNLVGPSVRGFRTDLIATAGGNCFAVDYVIGATAEL